MSWLTGAILDQIRYFGYKQYKCPGFKKKKKKAKMEKLLKDRGGAALRIGGKVE